MNIAATEQIPASALRDHVINPAEARTLWGLFRERVQRTPAGLAYRDYFTGSWRDHTWREIGARADQFRAALARTDIKTGDRVAVLLPNSVDWVCLDMAAHGSGLVVVALYPHDSPANIAYVLGHSDARLVLVDTAARWQSLAPHRAEFPALGYVWVRDGANDPAPTGAPVARSLTDVLQDTSPAPPPDPADPAATATLIYTSGTTGRPKGVMLSHAALLWNAKATADVIPPRLDDVFLSVLPLAHAFERTVGYYLPMLGGSAIAYARSPQDFRDDLIAIRPTVMLGVPLLYERMHAAILANAEGNIAKRLLVRLTASLGWQRRIKKNEGTGLARLLWPLLQRHVATPVMAAFGGRLRVAVSGGAPLDAEIAKFLIGVGLPLVEGYGLTETAPVVTATSLDDSTPGTVGRPLQGVDIRISTQGELLVHSPSIMTGYWKDDAQTARALDSAGWLATGDLAEFADNRICIRGRLKDMIVLSIGEKINPNVIEAEITHDALFDQAAVIGAGKPFLVALIVLNARAWKQFALENGIDPQRPNDEPAARAILTRLEMRLTALPRFAQIRAVHLRFEPWTIEAGLLTPTLKVKRDVLRRMFAVEIDALYAGR
jgi:long-chain acyl-CoA synthetase